MMPTWNPQSSPEEIKSQLSIWLSLLFESSPILLEKLIPQVMKHLADPTTPQPSSYTDILGIAIKILSTWPALDRAEFIAGHPRIGEVGNLSKLSAQEQAAAATPPHILRRLDHLNACYEHAFPGLRYIIFVNGRTRADIVPLIEETLRLEPIGEDAPTEERILQPPVSNVERHEVQSDAWTHELDRAIKDVGLIAYARLAAM